MPALEPDSPASRAAFGHRSAAFGHRSAAFARPSAARPSAIAARPSAIAARPSAALRGSGGAGAAGGRVVSGAAVDRCEPADVRDVDSERAARENRMRIRRMCRWRGRRQARIAHTPDAFLSIYSPFNLISDPPVRSRCSAQPGGPIATFSSLI